MTLEEILKNPSLFDLHKGEIAESDYDGNEITRRVFWVVEKATRKEERFDFPEELDQLSEIFGDNYTESYL